jgi:hypothetical protein
LPTQLHPTKNNVLIFFDMTAFSWKSPEPTAVGAGRSADTVSNVIHDRAEPPVKASEARL